MAVGARELGTSHLEIHQKESLARKTRYLYNFIYTFIDILHTTNSNLIVV